MKRFVLISLFLLSGLLGTSALKAQVIVRVRPDAPVYIGVRPPCPGPRYIWIKGHWRWDRYYRSYAWVEGHWARRRRGGLWIDGHWEDIPHQGYRWVPGHWG